MSDHTTYLERQIAGDQVCILWHAPGSVPESSLLRALDNKHMKIALADNAHSVFAAACACDGRARRTVIVLDDRDALNGVERVLSALKRFGPGVICWEHREGLNPPMVPIVQPEKPAKSVENGVAAATKPVSQAPPPNLRLVGEPASAQPDHAQEARSTPGPVKSRLAAPISARDVLDADELDALLASEMGEKPGRNPGHRPGRK